MVVANKGEGASVTGEPSRTAATAAPSEARCLTCGEPVSGNFCSSCGRAVSESGADGWSGVLKQVAKGDGNTLLATALAILREPVAGPVRLALDPAYGGHVKFYLTFVSAAFVAMFVAPQELSRTLLGLETAGDHSLVKRMMVLQALIVLVLTPVFYYAFRWRSTEQRSPLSFFKLSLLTITAGNVLVVSAIGLMLAAWIAVVVLSPFKLASDPAAVGAAFQTIGLIAALGALAYNTAIATRFWNIRWYWPAVLFLAGQLLVEAVSWPVLNALGSGGLSFMFK